ncbi:MAG: hypothetical protein SPE67_00005, partial [Dialister sp.]|nr:hypothetical protein [Dialister sp.]
LIFRRNMTSIRVSLATRRNDFFEVRGAGEANRFSIAFSLAFCYNTSRKAVVPWDDSNSGKNSPAPSIPSEKIFRCTPSVVY